MRRSSSRSVQSSDRAATVSSNCWASEAMANSLPGRSAQQLLDDQEDVHGRDAGSDRVGEEAQQPSVDVGAHQSAVAGEDDERNDGEGNPEGEDDLAEHERPGRADAEGEK